MKINPLLNLILTNPPYYGQHCAAMYDISRGLNKTLVALAAMSLHIDIADEIIFG